MPAVGAVPGPPVCGRALPSESPTVSVRSASPCCPMDMGLCQPVPGRPVAWGLAGPQHGFAGLSSAIPSGDVLARGIVPWSPEKFSVRSVSSCFPMIMASANLCSGTRLRASERLVARRLGLFEGCRAVLCGGVLGSRDRSAESRNVSVRGSVLRAPVATS